MRGNDTQQGAMFSYLMPEQRVPLDHPLRPILAMVDQALERIDGDLEKMYAAGGRPSIAPEKLLRGLLLQMLYSVRSERMLMEQMQYNLLFRWFVGLNMDDAVWDVTVFTKNRDRLLEGDIAQRFFQAVLEQAHAKQWMERCWRRGPARKASARKRSRRRRARAAGARCCCTTRTPARPIRRRASIASPGAARSGWCTWVTC
jgi:transposase